MSRRIPKGDERAGPGKRRRIREASVRRRSRRLERHLQARHGRPSRNLRQATLQLVNDLSVRRISNAKKPCQGGPFRGRGVCRSEVVEKRLQRACLVIDSRLQGRLEGLACGFVHLHTHLGAQPVGMRLDRRVRRRLLRPHEGHRQQTGTEQKNNRSESPCRAQPAHQGVGLT